MCASLLATGFRRDTLKNLGIMKEIDRKQFHHNNPTLQFKLLKVLTSRPYSRDVKATRDHLGELPQQEN